MQPLNCPGATAYTHTLKSCIIRNYDTIGENENSFDIYSVHRMMQQKEARPVSLSGNMQ